MEYHLGGSERERMEDMLCDAALWGNLTLLHDVIAREFSILDRVLVGSFKGKNPLYVAISAGKTEFVLELLKIKPDLAEVLDTEFGVALHLASAKGHIEIVKALVKVSPEMCLARDRDGNSPVHVVAMKGQVEVLKELARTNSLIAQEKVDRGDTILHLCVKYNQFKCLEILLDMIPNPDFVNVADSGGNTILHLAVSEKRLEMIKHVLSGSKIDVNAKNNSGRTALDMYFLAGGNPTGSEIQVILLNAGAKTREQSIVEVGVEDLGKMESERRNTSMIVASLIATMTFLFGLTPPGGVFTDDSTGPGRAGKSILAYTDHYTFSNLVIGNSIAFLLSLTSILLLISALPETNKTYKKTRKVITWFTVTATVFAFVFSVVAISPHGSKARNGLLIANTVWGVVMLVFVERSFFFGK